MQVRKHSVLTLEVSEALDTSDLLYLQDEVRDAVPPLQRFEHALHPWVAFLIMPLFGLANSGVSLAGMSVANLTAPVFLGTAVGLFVGKQLGIFAFTWAAVKVGAAEVPGGAPWGSVYGVAMVAGIGFTVALFIANLAFGAEPELLKRGEARGPGRLAGLGSHRDARAPGAALGGKGRGRARDLSARPVSAKETRGLGARLTSRLRGGVRARGISAPRGRRRPGR